MANRLQRLLIVLVFRERQLPDLQLFHNAISGMFSGRLVSRQHAQSRHRRFANTRRFYGNLRI